MSFPEMMRGDWSYRRFMVWPPPAINPCWIEPAIPDLAATRQAGIDPDQGLRIARRCGVDMIRDLAVDTIGRSDHHLSEYDILNTRHGPSHWLIHALICSDPTFLDQTAHEPVRLYLLIHSWKAGSSRNWTLLSN